MIRKLIVIMGCIHLLGGSFGVLQIVAWAGMLVQYSSSEGVSEGISKTFDGEHPCSLCLAIKEVKDQQSEKQPLQVASDKLSLKELALPTIITLRNPTSRPTVIPPFLDPIEHCGSRADSPPVPPPRLLS
ncbi:hypothetical protein ACFQY0_07035 [Haloferula chungangensis]|uniref:DUF2946 domain-containing protein n=1 Tax=Haloferula chungangensis TaxID=1048331 RepID=A0ABW2L5T9_9BACT